MDYEKYILALQAQDIKILELVQKLAQELLEINEKLKEYAKLNSRR